jgi:hypothetical protein
VQTAGGAAQGPVQLGAIGGREAQQGRLDLRGPIDPPVQHAEDDRWSALLGSFAGRAVDRLTQQVGVTVVAAGRAA